MQNFDNILKEEYEIWIDGRVVEGARLEIVYTSKGYPGFESLSIRQFNEKDAWKQRLFSYPAETRFLYGNLA